jgi:transcriptional regulator with XRE-family HTH domain
MAEQDIRPEEIAYKLGVSASTVARWMAGSNEPTRGMGQRLAELFAVDRKTFYEEAA